MSNERIAIKFNSLHMLWQFAQNIQARDIQIKTHECLLICACSDEDLLLIAKYKGLVVEQVVVQNN